jgi:hypothetical protein
MDASDTKKSEEALWGNESEVHVNPCGGETMIETFAFDVCHDVYRAAREAIDSKIPTMNLETSGKYLWHPDRMPRLNEYVADFARAGARALEAHGPSNPRPVRGANPSRQPLRGSRMVMFRVYYLGGAEYHAARQHLGISELTWADWADEIRTCVGRELTRSGVFPPSRYFRKTTERSLGRARKKCFRSPQGLKPLTEMAAVCHG